MQWLSTFCEVLFHLRCLCGRCEILSQASFYGGSRLLSWNFSPISKSIFQVEVYDLTNFHRFHQYDRYGYWVIRELYRMGLRKSAFALCLPLQPLAIFPLPFRRSMQFHQQMRHVRRRFRKWYVIILQKAIWHLNQWHGYNCIKWRINLYKI